MNWDILSSYMQGECSGDEFRQLQNWLKEDAANEDFFQSWVEASECEPDTKAGDAHKAWEKFKKTHLNDKKFAPVLHETEYMPSKTWWASSGQKWVMVGSAAVLVLLLTAAAVFLLQSGDYFSAGKTPKKIAYRTIITQKGQQTKLRLKDGTKIMLNADSKLRIPKNYGHAKRVVYLHGEAFFKVVHNASMPFTVKLGQLKIQDVGTAFDILAYDSTQISVAVKEGAVSVGRIPKTKTGSTHFLGELTKNKAGRFTDNETFSISTIDDMSLFTGWTKGQLVFRNTPLSQVVKKLERRFNVNTKILGPTLKKRTLTAAYDHLSLDQILNIMSVSLHVKFVQRGDSIIFKPKK